MLDFKPSKAVFVLAVASLFTAGAMAADKSGIDAFQEKVNRIADEHGVERPDVRKVVTGENEQTERGTLEEKIRNVPKIDRVVDMGIHSVRAIKSADGKIIYMADMGRFVFTGQLFDIWQKKPLTTIEEIADAVRRIDLSTLGFKPDALNLARIGTGSTHVTVFVDPLCGWCHKLMDEVAGNADIQKDYTFDFIVVPALGKPSHELARRLYCGESDVSKRFEILRGGREAIEALDSPGTCDAKGYDTTLAVSQMLGIESVPFVIAPDGRFSRGKPSDLRAFLEGNASDGGTPALKIGQK